MTQHSSDQPGGSPAGALVPQGRLDDAKVVIAAARDILTSEPQRRDEVGGALLHLVELRIEKRPAVARAIVELVPEQRAAAVAKLVAYLDGDAVDPWIGPRPGKRRDFERLAVLVSLAVLDADAYAASARELFESCDTEALLACGVDYGRLGGEHGRLAVERMVRDFWRQDGGPGSAPWRAVDTAKLLIQLGDDQIGAVRDVITEMLEQGIALGVLARPLRSLDPEMSRFAVEVALASLRMDPQRLLVGDRSQNDVPAVVKAAGEKYLPQLTRALLDIADSEDTALAERFQAAARLDVVSAELRAETERRLLAGVETGGSSVPVPSPEVAAQVAEAWHRIEEHLREHAPAVLAALPGPATAEEIALTQQRLGVTFPEDFVASLAHHREVSFGSQIDTHTTHFSLEKLPEMRDAAEEATQFSDPDGDDDELRRDDTWRDGWIPLSFDGDGSVYALDLDPGPLGRYGQIMYADQGNPDSVAYSGWLELLREFADDPSPAR